VPGELEVIGPAVRVPGSDQFMLFVGVLVLAVGAVGVVAAVVLRRRRARRGVHRPPVLVAVTTAVALLGAVTVVANRPLAFEVPEFPPLPRLLPEQAFFYRPATDLPVSADSGRWIGSLTGADGEPLTLFAGFSGEVVDGVVFGLPFNPVDGSTARVDVDIVAYPEVSFAGPYPIADPAYIESMPSYGIDNHYVAVDPGARAMWELLSARRWFGRWFADAGARWSMDSLAYGPGSSIASGLPLLPGTITYDEVAAGRIGHVVLGISPVVARADPRWPARATDGTSTDPDAPPMGAWLRLRPEVAIDDLPPQARVVARGLQEFGTVISDTGGVFGLRGTPDRRWDDADLAALQRFSLDDFEVVDPSAVQVATDSMAARPVAE
jgi:hypothetical protein